MDDAAIVGGTLSYLSPEVLAGSGDGCGRLSSVDPAPPGRGGRGLRPASAEALAAVPGTRSQFCSTGLSGSLTHHGGASSYERATLILNPLNPAN